jgi:glutamate synthase (NADPH/NADH) small chain
VEKEVEYIKKLGVEIKKDFVIGKTLSMDDLKQNFEAVFIGVGAGLPVFMNIPGESLPGVYSANEFLTRINLMQAYDFPNHATPIKKVENVVVVGGGNVAIDSARCAKRLGSQVTLVYRRGVEEMPARQEEIQNAKEEGIELLFLTNPTKIIGVDKVEGIECIQMMLGHEDIDGRKTPVPIENSEFVIKCQQVIIAIGQGPNPLLVKSLKLDQDSRGYLFTDERMQTSDPIIFAGGDIVKGAATVIKAMGDGKKAAKAIDEYLKSK